MLIHLSYRARLALAVLLMLTPAAAWAQTQRDLDRCMGKEATAQSVIDGCTVLIKTKVFTGNNLAIAFVNRCTIYGRIGDNDRAIVDCNKAIRLSPRMAIAYNSRGMAYYNKSHLSGEGAAAMYSKKGLVRALADFDQAIRIDANYVQAYNNRALVYGQLADYARAIADYDKSIALNPKFAEAYNGRGVIYHSEGDDVHALADYNKAIAVDPNYADPYRNRADLERAKDAKAAERDMAAWQKLKDRLRL